MYVSLSHFFIPFIHTYTHSTYYPMRTTGGQRRNYTKIARRVELTCFLVYLIAIAICTFIMFYTPYVLPADAEWCSGRLNETLSFYGLMLHDEDDALNMIQY